MIPEVKVRKIKICIYCRFMTHKNACFSCNSPNVKTRSQLNEIVQDPTHEDYALCVEALETMNDLQGELV